MGFLKFLLTMGITAVGFFIGGSLTRETGGAVIGAGLGLIVALILVNFWRAMLKLALIAGVLGLIALAVYSYTESPGWPPTSLNPSGSAKESGPEDEELIRAVYDHLQGKTYTDVETNIKVIQVPCTKLDYDWHRCSGSDGLYGHKIEEHPVTKTIQRDCPPPLPISSPFWQVKELTEESWEVSNTQGRWMVEEIGSEFHIKTQEYSAPGECW